MRIQLQETHRNYQSKATAREHFEIENSRAQIFFIINLAKYEAKTQQSITKNIRKYSPQDFKSVEIYPCSSEANTQSESIETKCDCLDFEG